MQKPPHQTAEEPLDPVSGLERGTSNDPRVPRLGRLQRITTGITAVKVNNHTFQVVALSWPDGTTSSTGCKAARCARSRARRSPSVLPPPWSKG